MRKLGDPESGGTEKGEERMARYATVLNEHLKGREWLCGGPVAFADFTAGSYLELAEAAHYPLKPYAEIWRWYRNLDSLPEWRRSAPENFKRTTIRAQHNLRSRQRSIGTILAAHQRIPRSFGRRSLAVKEKAHREVHLGIKERTKDTIMFWGIGVLLPNRLSKINLFPVG